MSPSVQLGGVQKCPCQWQDQGFAHLPPEQEDAACFCEAPPPGTAVDAVGEGAGCDAVMAVQAALMTPQFANFCFPPPVLEYEAEKPFDGSLLGEGACEGDFREATRDLLSFIDSASSNIKLALDKPVKSRRKVNHRKYLQKQIKRCAGIAGTLGAAQDLGKRPGSSPPTHPGGCVPARPPSKRDGLQANLQSRSLAALFEPMRDARGDKARKPPLRQRNLPPSFFTEPAHCARVTSTSGVTLKDLERGNPEAADFLELLGPDYSGMLTGEQETVPPCASGQSARTEAPQPPPYCPSDSSVSSTLEEAAPCALAFHSFFTECSIPPGAYDFGAGYSRAAFPSL
ncbi:protein FAM181B-like [Scleropages formosus]|uniref:Protein FAM181B-like n=1 Tax=Scleropages formosus TaxID=113540 RepID=A0A0P7XN64_SCLFO|nr:protein FAM181B-like [Scleropages formosus]